MSVLWNNYNVKVKFDFLSVLSVSTVGLCLNDVLKVRERSLCMVFWEMLQLRPFFATKLKYYTISDYYKRERKVSNSGQKGPITSNSNGLTELSEQIPSHHSS